MKEESDKESGKKKSKKRTKEVNLSLKLGDAVHGGIV